MSEVSSLPGNESARLLDTAEKVYLSFVVERGDRALSIEVLDELEGLVNLDLLTEYEDSLFQFGLEFHEKLGMLYEDFGSHRTWQAI